MSDMSDKIVTVLIKAMLWMWGVLLLSGLAALVVAGWRQALS